MRWLLAILLIFIVATAAYAQEQTMITMFEGEIENGGFGGPVFKVTQMAGDTAILFGPRGGWIINHKVLVGGAMQMLTNDIKAEGALSDIYRLRLGYGGIELGYIFKSDSLVHMTAGALIGAGGAGYRNLKVGNYNNASTDNFFVAEPALGIELNLSRYMRIETTASYRYVNGIGLEGLSDSDISGLSGSATLKFGRF